MRVELPPATEDAAAARVRLAACFPRTSLRRMTHLGLLLGHVLEDSGIGAEDAVVYASSYAETRALEDYLGSFPHPSPLLFQTSIHPSGVQQGLIARQQPIARLWPMAGRARLLEHALLAALLEPAARVALAGGEERGTWMLDLGHAADRAFAFAAVFGPPAGSGRTPAPARIRFVPGDDAHDDSCPSLLAFAEALGARSPLAWKGSGGCWSLVWS